MSNFRAFLEYEPATNKRNVWWRMVSIDSAEIRHNLTQWSESTLARAKQQAKLEGLPLLLINSPEWNSATEQS